MAALPLLVANAFLGAVALTAAEPWPWATICNRYYRPYDYKSHECVATSNRSELPVLNSSAEYEVFYLARPVEGGVGPVVSSLVGFTHTAIGFKQRNGHEEFQLEFFAINLGLEVIMPFKLDGRFDWKDRAVMGWVPKITNDWADKILLGVASGIVVNKFLSWVPMWHGRHSSYELWSAWSDPDLKAGMVRHFNDTTCNTFVEDALWELYRLGAPLSSSITLCRNYFVFITGRMDVVTSHGLRGSLRRHEMEAYYTTLNTLQAKVNGSHIPVLRWLEMAATTVLEMLQPGAFLYHGPSNSYYFAHLRKPYMKFRPMYLNQRMVLPWQLTENARLGECGPWANTAASASDDVVVV